jgi:molecular chaperone GrpE
LFSVQKKGATFGLQVSIARLAGISLDQFGLPQRFESTIFTHYDTNRKSWYFMKDSETEIENGTDGAGQQSEPLTRLDAATLAPEQLEELKQRAAKADENWERLLRTTADFDNYKKRATREKQDAIRFANEGLLEKLVPVLDSFDMALAAAESSQAEAAQSLKTGITMVHQQFRTALASAGLEEIDATGKPFDPNLHEAVSQQEHADLPEGQVVQQLRRGYKLRERLLRPASVIVSKHPAA